MIFRLGYVFYDVNERMSHHAHGFYGKMHKWFHRPPGIVQDLNIIGLLFYGPLPDTFFCLGWHGRFIWFSISLNRASFRKSEVGVGSRKSEVGSRKSEVGSRKSEVGSRKSEVGSRKSEVGSRKSEVGSR